MMAYNTGSFPLQFAERPQPGNTRMNQPELATCHCIISHPSKPKFLVIKHSDRWAPPTVGRTSLYLHVPFCRHTCPYCPYTKIRYDETLIRFSGIDADKFPDIVPCTEILGTLKPEVAEALGLSPEVRVVAGAIPAPRRRAGPPQAQSREGRRAPGGTTSHVSHCSPCDGRAAWRRG